MTFATPQGTPDSVTNLKAVAELQQITFTWTPSPSYQGIPDVQIATIARLNDSLPAETRLLTFAQDSLVITGLRPFESVRIVLQARNTAGNTSPGVSLVVTTIASLPQAFVDVTALPTLPNIEQGSSEASDVLLPFSFSFDERLTNGRFLGIGFTFIVRDNTSAVVSTITNVTAQQTMTFVIPPELDYELRVS